MVLHAPASIFFESTRSVVATIVGICSLVQFALSFHRIIVWRKRLILTDEASLPRIPQLRLTTTTEIVELPNLISLHEEGWRDISYRPVCDDGATNDARVNTQWVDAPIKNRKALLSHCKESCYTELLCVGFQIVGCQINAIECRGGCRLLLASNASIGRHMSGSVVLRMGSGLESARSCAARDSTRYYKMEGDLAWRQELLSTMARIAAAGPVAPPAYKYLFDGCCCGWKTVLPGGEKNIPECSKKCSDLGNCHAFEVHGCKKDGLECSGPCFLLVGGNIHNCKRSECLRPIAFNKCFKMEGKVRLAKKDRDAVSVWKAKTSYPFFDSVEALENNPQWKSYLQGIYGTTIYNSSHYPIDVSKFNVLYRDRLRRAHLKLHPESRGPVYDYALHTCWISRKPENEFIYHTKIEGVESYSQVEVMHLGGQGQRFWESSSYWMYVQPGTGIFYKVGRTEVFTNHAAAVKRFLRLTCFGQCDQFYTRLAAKARKTHDSLQFTHHCDQCSTNICTHEIVDLNSPGRETCSINFTIGFGGTTPCDCTGPFLHCRNLGRV